MLADIFLLKLGLFLIPYFIIGYDILKKAGRGIINLRPFFCTCGVGYDAFISKQFAKSKLRGPLVYIENVLKDIHDKGLPFDKVTVITGDMNVYQEQLLYYADRYDLPMTLSDGYPVYLLNTGKVLKGIFQWDQEEYHNFNVLWNVVNSKNFNIRLLKEKVFKGIETPGKLKDIVKLVSSMRLSINEEENKRKIDRYLQAAGEEETDTIEALRRFSEELEKGYGYFAAEYAERETRISDSLSRQCILSYFEDLQGEPFTSNHLNDLLNRRIGSESFRAGFMHITSLRGAFSSIRNYNYLIGLSADYFPGSPKENYLLLDSDLDLFAFDRALTSSEKIEQKKEMLYHFLGLASGLNKTLRLSYAGYDTSELKDQNASSLLFEIFRLTRGEEASMEDFKKNIRHTGYFDTDISNYAAVGREYLKEAEITDNPEESREKLKFDLPQRSFSPTAIDAYFNCPRKFYLTKILGIEEPEEHDPFEIIRANDLGTLVHEMMELTADHSLTEEDFVQQANIAFDRYLSEHVPVSKEKAERSRQEYLQMIRTGYRQNPKNRVISAENRFYTTHESGIRLNGTPDRIEYTDDGRCIIVDYKTYRNEENLENDYESCRQVIIYAYISEKNGYKPEHCEYRYLRYPVVVKCVYNDQMKELLAKDLETLKKALEENDFPCTENKDSCTFCKLAHICGKSEVNKDEQ